MNAIERVRSLPHQRLGIVRAGIERLDSQEAARVALVEFLEQREEGLEQPDCGGMMA
jgi:hypothetical protein